MSKRAGQASEEGRFPKTDFKKEYKVSQKSFEELVDLGIIKSRERYIYEVVVARKSNNRYYLHEVWTEKSLTNVGSNAVQGQPSRLQGVAKILQDIVTTNKLFKNS